MSAQVIDFPFLPSRLSPSDDGKSGGAVGPPAAPLTSPDRDMALALADAGYLPWAEYIEFYSCAPDLAPDPAPRAHGVYVDPRRERAE